MPRYVAFLRGIGLGKRRPPMSQLKTLFEEMGFDDVATFIASGNVVFSTRAADRAKLENKISRHLASALGYDVESFVRSEDEVRAIGASEPFAEDVSGATTVQVCLLREALPAADAAKLTLSGQDQRGHGVERRAHQGHSLSELYDAQHDKHPQAHRAAAGVTGPAALDRRRAMDAHAVA
jgi:uncharacterized protein (DUF1697 family)